MASSFALQQSTLDAMPISPSHVPSPLKQTPTLTASLLIPLLMPLTFLTSQSLTLSPRISSTKHTTPSPTFFMYATSSIEATLHSPSPISSPLSMLPSLYVTAPTSRFSSSASMSIRTPYLSKREMTGLVPLSCINFHKYFIILGFVNHF
ncbi:hypothetical protein MA16_Dca007970 [Dendrobium catenatum]|uniref:Uncharacterized protein n=1 Tax=Dendrobium catenatum TaxID=906689 RepID=A0A2I0VKY9_9ASPA|nr:hypothetical protein MA16_Dca007970 [Dendrobium catenatum]